MPDTTQNPVAGDPAGHSRPAHSGGDDRGGDRRSGPPPRFGGGGGGRGDDRGGDRGGPRGGGDRGGDRGGPRGGGGDDRGDGGPRRPRRFHRGKVCQFCVDKAIYVDYKDLERLRMYVTDSGKILPRRITGACARHQRMINVALKRARNLALLPFKVR